MRIHVITYIALSLHPFSGKLLFDTVIFCALAIATKIKTVLLLLQHFDLLNQFTAQAFEQQVQFTNNARQSPKHDRGTAQVFGWKKILFVLAEIYNNKSQLFI